MIVALHHILLSLLFAGQSSPANSMGLDILIYTVIAIGFVILGFFISNFYNKARVQAMEAEVEAEKERFSRRISTLEKEVKHLYSKDDEQTVIINDLKKQLQKARNHTPDTKGKAEKSQKKDISGPGKPSEDQD